jgi:hypothetical protein
VAKLEWRVKLVTELPIGSAWGIGKLTEVGPAFTSTSPILLNDTERSRCQAALPGSDPRISARDEPDYRKLAHLIHRTEAQAVF